MTVDNLEAAAEGQPVDATTEDGTADRVLYAGDDPPNGPTASELSSTVDGVEVSPERDFAAALERVEAGAVDCAVVTHRADGFDGIAFLEAVRRERAAFPIVLVPSHAGGDIARRAVAADATALVPATAADALDAVADAVETHAAAAPGEADTRMPISDLTLKEERRLKERALDEAPVGITIADAADPENPVIYANDSFVEITGYPHEEVVGVNHRFLQGPDTDPDQVRTLANGIAEERDVRVVLRNYTREGEPFWNQVDVSPIRDGDGEVTHYVGFQMDVTERERTRRELAAERAALDRLLNRVNGLVNDVTEALVQADDRAGIESSVIERVRTGDEYAAAWLGRFDEADDRVRVTRSTGETSSPERSIDLDAADDAPGIAELRTAIEERSAQVVTDSEGLPEIDGGATCLLVPLSYRSTTYGVLAVCGEPDLLDDRERVLLESLGRSVGTSINDVLTKRTMTTDTVLNIGVEVVDDHFLVSLADDLDCAFDHEATMTEAGGEQLLVLASTDHDDAAAVVERAERHDAVLAAEVIVDDDDGSVVQFRVGESPLVDTLSAAGARLTSLNTGGTSLEVEFRVGTEDAARRALNGLRETYDDIELLAYHETDEPASTARGFREEVRNELTERQLTALQKAFASGFFEWPRRADGEQLAESMDIVPSTYHQHLQAAKRKLVGAFLEE